MRNNTGGRRHPVLATEQVHLMPCRTEANGGLEKIPFGASLEIEPLMNQRDFHSSSVTGFHDIVGQERARIKRP
jgi:hypothetical protein